MADSKATPAKTDDRPSTPWGKDVEILDGLNLIDKAELVGKPFLIEEIWFEIGSRNIEYAYVKAQFQNGEEFTFNDSSSGVRAQLEQYLKTSKGSDPEIGQTVPVRLMIPNGLRFSEYEVVDKGKTRMAKTYYLTTSGKRAQ